MKYAGFWLLLVSLIAAQDANGQSLKQFGVKFGGVMATQAWTYTTSTKLETQFRFGPAAGIFVEGFDVGPLTFLGEFWYVQRGFKTTAPRLASPALVYLSFPVLVKFNMGERSFNYFLSAGPRVDYLFHIDPQGLAAVTDAFSEGDSDLGIVAGAGMELPVASLFVIQAEVRASPGIIDLYSDRTLSIRSTSIDLVIGLAF